MEHVQQQIHSAVTVHVIHALPYPGQVVLVGNDLHPNGIGHVLFRHGPDVFGHGGAQQQGLSLARQQAEDLIEVAGETHVEHAVAFVEHEQFHFAELEVTLIIEVQKPSRSGDHNRGLPAQGLLLGLLPHTTVQQGDFEGQGFAIGREIVVDLNGQLARGRQYQHTYTPGGYLAGGQPMKDGKCKGCRFTGSRLSE